MSLALIGNFAIKEISTTLPQDVDDFKFIQLSLQNYYDHLKKLPWVYDFRQINIGIESSIKANIEGIKKIGTLIAALRLIKPNTGILRGMVENPNNSNIRITQIAARSTPIFLDKRITEKRIDKRDFEILRQIWPKIEVLYSTDQFFSRIRNAIDFIEHSRWSFALNDSLINLVTGIESLFTTDNLELSYKISLRGSWFMHPLKQDYKKRQLLFSDLKQMYAYRSTILHGGNISKFHGERKKHLQTAQYVLRASIIKILRDKHNEDLFRIFNSKDSKNLEQYFLKLTTGELAFK